MGFYTILAVRATIATMSSKTESDSMRFSGSVHSVYKLQYSFSKMQPDFAGPSLTNMFPRMHFALAKSLEALIEPWGVKPWVKALRF